MTTGPSSKRHVTQERCSRGPLQVGDNDILKDPGENWAVIEFSCTAISHTMIAALILVLGVVVSMMMSTFAP